MRALPYVGLTDLAADLYRTVPSLREMEVGSYLRMEAGGYMPLAVEIIDGGDGWRDVSLCHYGEANGDAMRDPEMIFRIFAAKGGAKAMAWPTEYRNDWVGARTVAVEWYDGGRYGVRHRTLSSHLSFAKTWLRNLRAQGHRPVARKPAAEVAA